MIWEFWWVGCPPINISFCNQALKKEIVILSLRVSVGFCGALLCLIRLTTRPDLNNVAWFFNERFFET